MAALGMVMLVATTGVACSSTNSTTNTTAAGSNGTGRPPPPASSFSDHTGITSTEVKVGNVATLAVGGLFKGAQVGTEAYAAYVNSTGGVNGRRIVVDAGDDNFTGATNKQATQNAVSNDFASVGSFSLQDSFGGVVLAQNPGFPDVSVKLDLHTGKLPNVYSAVPAAGGWQEGPLQYFKAKFPQEIGAVGTLISNLPSAQPGWNGEKYVMDQLGYKVLYVGQVAVTQADFTQNVITMKNDGVKLLVIDQLPENYAAPLIQAMVQQNFHPVTILGAAAYSNLLVNAAGGPSAVNGDYLSQNSSLYLGGDATTIPAVATFLHWVDMVSPGFRVDLFTLYGWLSGELFAQALANAGSNPSRGSELQALDKVTSFNGNNIIATTYPVTRNLSNCYLLGQVVSGVVQRLDDPPPTGSTNGYRCDYQYVKPPGT